MKSFRQYKEDIDPSAKGQITKKDINWDAKSDLKKLKKKPGSTREPSPQERVRESFSDWLTAKCRLGQKSPR